jgi:hypothetical protein
VGAGSDTSTIVLGDIGGVEKGTQYGYNSDELFLGNINTETLPLRLGESRI